MGIPAYVTDEQQLIGLSDRVEDQCGTPTDPVNNAGSTPQHRLVDTTIGPRERYRWTETVIEPPGD